MTTIDRTAYPRLDKTLGSQELQSRYELNEEERRFINLSAKGASQTLTLAVLIKTRQQLGYFPLLREVPDQITQYLSEQLGHPLETTVIDEKRLRTSLKRYRDTIRVEHSSKSFTPGGQQRASQVIRTAAAIMSDPADLINVAVEELIKANIELPAFSTLDRLAGHVRQKVHEELYARMTNGLTSGQQEILEKLLVVPDGENFTPFNRLKQSPGTPTLGHVRLWADHLGEMEAIIDPTPFLEGIAYTKIRQFAAEAEALHVSDMLDIRQTGKRHALLLCLLQHVQTRTRDELVEMFQRRMRRTRNAAKDKLRSLQEGHRVKEETLLSTFGQILRQAKVEEKSPQDFGTDVKAILEKHGGTEHLLQEYEVVSAYHQNNYLPLMWDIHAKNRTVLFRLLGLLKIGSASQDEKLIKALAYVREHRTARRDVLPYDIDLDFSSQNWRNFVITRENKTRVLDRRALEVCVFTHVADALACGNLYVESAETYNDPRAQLLPWDECETRLAGYCGGVGISADPATFVANLRKHFTAVAANVDAGFPANSELTIDADGTPHLKKLKKASKPENLKAFQDEVKSRMPERHLLDILKYANHWTGYTRHFGPPSGSDPKLSDANMRYIFAVYGNGCLMGDSQTARHSPPSIDRQTLGRINAQHVTIEKLEAALRDLINEFARFDLTQFWGKGQAAIADGTHFELVENNLMGERHIRYGGYGGIAYHHISDNYVALFCNFIACGVWEAVYILDGLLQNTSNIQPDTLHADTHGQSEPVFGLAHLLGIKLFPRMRNWNHVTFYRPTKDTKYKHIDDLFGDPIDWKLIETHWQDMMQIVLSIQAGKILPSMLLRKLGTKSRKNKLYRAFRELGRVERTIFLLRYISEADFRFSIRAETTKIESFHSFLDWITFGGTVIKSGDPIEQAKRMKYMDVVANAIMLQNVVDLTDVLTSMAEDGFKITPELVASLSPYMREQILRFGRLKLDMSDIPAPLQPKSIPIAA